MKTGSEFRFFRGDAKRVAVLTGGGIRAEDGVLIGRQNGRVKPPPPLAEAAADKESLDAALLELARVLSIRPAAEIKQKGFYAVRDDLAQTVLSAEFGSFF